MKSRKRLSIKKKCERKSFISLNKYSHFNLFPASLEDFYDIFLRPEQEKQYSEEKNFLLLEMEKFLYNQKKR